MDRAGSTIIHNIINEWFNHASHNKPFPAFAEAMISAHKRERTATSIKLISAKKSHHVKTSRFFTALVSIG